MQADRIVEALRLAGDRREEVSCRIADEVAIELRYNSIPHAVLMATPRDLADLAVGFSCTDDLCLPGEITRIDQHPQDGAVIVDIGLAAAAFERFLQRRQTRTLRSFTSCGVCGIESAGTLPRTRPTRSADIDLRAIRRALRELPDHQPLNRATGAIHAASWADADGRIVLAREDVGRHNALDKLIGARAAASAPNDGGFCVVTSRCSFEMVQKATAAGMGLLVCISAPTSLAVTEAERNGLSLIALARADSQIVYAGRDRIRP